MIDTLANVKTFLDISGSDYDAYLTSFCEQVDAIIKGYLGRDLESADYVEYYDGNGLSRIMLRQMPVTAVTTIELWDGDSYEEVTSDDYDRLLILYEENGVYLEGYTFIRGTQNYRVTYTAGYEADDMPADIKMAFRQLVMLGYDESPLKNRTLGKLSKVESGSGASLVINVDKKEQDRVLQRIGNYRKVNV